MKLANTLALTVVAIFGASSTARADISYSYDALGRLTSVCDAQPASGNLTSYQFDKASNRSYYTHSRTDHYINIGEHLQSPNGKYSIDMQGDGNLVIYMHTSSGIVAMWSTNTVGTGSYFSVMQSDGNFVLYSNSGPVWNSGTWQYPCATLSVQDDGNVVIKNVAGNIVWSTGTGGH